MTVSTVKDFMVFNKPDIGEEEMSAVMDVMRSGWLGTGKVAHQFEEEFSNFMGGGYSVAVSSCTIGLQMALRSLEIGYDDQDEVITSPLTFAATANAVYAIGATPVFVDVDENGCLDIEKVNKKIGMFTKAVIPVHYSGTPCNMKGLDLTMDTVEDCAHAFGASFKSFGDFKVFSFYPNKNITSGEGGMVWTMHKKLADKIRILSSQGLSKGSWERFGEGPVKRYSVEEIGFKGNLPDILAAIGLVQLRRWPEMKVKRQAVFNVYEKAFGKMPTGHSTHLYPLRIKNRDKVRQRLQEKGIGTGVHYVPLHLEPAYKFLGYKQGDFPNAEKWGQEEMSLPVSSTMTEEDALRVVKLVKESM